MFINPLDRVPQIRQDYANHMLYAAFLWFILAIIFDGNCALQVVFFVGLVKKIVDFFYEMESIFVCVSKTIFTGLGAVIPWLGWVWGSSQFYAFSLLKLH